MRLREHRCGGLVALAMIVVAPSAACVGPRTPATLAPYTVRLLGASDGALRGTVRDGHSVFAGRAGSDYGVEVTNSTPADVGINVVIDGLDAKTGEPVATCEGGGGWILPSNGRAVIRGFPISETRIATYRFTPREQSLAARTKGARGEAIGTVEVCFFSTKPLARPATGARSTFTGIARDVDAPPSRDDREAHEVRKASITGELRDEELSPGADRELADLIKRIVVTYEGESGPLGTAPPPPQPARVGDNPRVAPGPSAPEEAIDDPKPGKPTKTPKSPKPTKTPSKAPSPGKPEK
jgi:hypothetical protein